MKKALRILGVIVLILALAIVIGGLVGPKHFAMKRTVEIKAPKAQIYKTLTDYTNFKKWSPWQHLDSAMTQETYGPQGQVGAGYKYKGNKDVGEGEMKTIALKENERMDIQLTFSAPIKSTPVSAFVLEDGADGATKVTWSFEQKEVPFVMSAMMLVMNMDKIVGPDYERGLANLKELSEKEAASGGQAQAAIEVKEGEWPGQTYICMRKEVDMKDIGETFQKLMPKTDVHMKDNKMEQDGAPAGLYFTWDTVKHMTDMAAAIPVKEVKGNAKGKDYTMVTIAKSKAVMVDYYGSYDKMAAAHGAIMKYIKDKGMKQKSPVIEVYATDPGTEKDPNKVLTKIYYLVD